MKKLFFCAIALAFNYQVSAQSLKGTEAFSASYTSEAKGDFRQAMSDLAGAKDGNLYAWNLRMGWLNYLAGSQDQSALFYNEAIKMKPQSVEARLGLAYPVAAQKQWDKLGGIYREVLKITPGNSNAMYLLGLLDYNLGNFAKAQTTLDELIKLYPFDYSGVVLQAWACLKQGKYDEARTGFNQALLIKPGDTSALEGLRLLKK